MKGLSEICRWGKGMVLIWLVVSVGQYLFICLEQWRFKKLVKNQVSLALVFGSLGQGKSLLFSWLVNRLTPTYTNFWHRKKDNKILLLDYLNVRGKSQIPTERAYYFVDEINLSIRGVDYQKNQKQYPGIEDFCALARHFSKTVFFSVQRPNQLGNVIREIANIYIKVKGVSVPFFLPWCRILSLEVYEDLALAEAGAANMEPYQKKSGFFSFFSANDYHEAKQRLNIRNYRVLLGSNDFTSYDTKFFAALLPLINKNRKEEVVPANKVPVPKTLQDVVKQPYFVIENKTEKESWGKRLRGGFKRKKVVPERKGKRRKWEKIGGWIVNLLLVRKRKIKSKKWGRLVINHPLWR